MRGQRQALHPQKGWAHRLYFGGGPTEGLHRGNVRNRKSHQKSSLPSLLADAFCNPDLLWTPHRTWCMNPHFCPKDTVLIPETKMLQTFKFSKPDSEDALYQLDLACECERESDTR